MYEEKLNKKKKKHQSIHRKEKNQSGLLLVASVHRFGGVSFHTQTHAYTILSISSIDIDG